MCMLPASERKMDAPLIAVSQQSVFLAESRVLGCAACSPNRATIRFERLLDRITGAAAPSSYVLPKIARCPSCNSPLLEATLVDA